MARLFYEQDEGVSYPRLGFEMKGNLPDTKRYFEKIAKIVPSEIVAGYLTLVGFVPLIGRAAVRPWAYAVAFSLCLTLTPLYMNAQAVGVRPKRRHIVLSSVAFVVWAYAVSGNAAAPNFYDPAVASLLLVAFSLISGVIPLNV
jgi:hypothetical protein